MKQNEDQPGPRTDFLSLITEMRGGAVVMDLNAKFNEVIGGVLETGQKGEMVVTFTLEPQKFGMGGVVLEVAAEHKVKIKRPELKIGSSVFFATDDGVLTREDPAQEKMFRMEDQPSYKEK